MLTDEDLEFLYERPRPLAALPDGEESAAHELLAELGSEVFQPRQLLGLLRSSDRLAGREPRWFTKLYSYLQKRGDDLLDEIRDAPFVLCEDGRLRAPDDGVLLPLTQDIDQEVYKRCARSTPAGVVSMVARMA